MGTAYRSKTDTIVILHNENIVTCYPKIWAYVRDGGTSGGNDVTEYKVDLFEFDWSSNASSMMDGVYNVDYSIHQASFALLGFIRNFDYFGSHSFPDHHTFGYFSKSVNPSEWARVCNDVGFACASGEIEVYFTDYGGYKISMFSAGWGGILWA